MQGTGGSSRGALPARMAALRCRNRRRQARLLRWGLGFGVWGLGFGVWGLGFDVRVCEVTWDCRTPVEEGCGDGDGGDEGDREGMGHG